MPTIKKAERPPWMPERKVHGRRLKPNSEVYNQRNYRKRVRLHKMRNPYCVECEKQGLITPVDVTDHVDPINQGGAVYDEANWQSLCHTCHNRKSGGEAHGKG